MLAPSVYAGWLERAGDRDVTDVLDINTDVAPMAEQLLALGAKIVVIKCGARGLYYRAADRESLLAAALPIHIDGFADQAGFMHSFRPSKVVSATGAGDTSIAAFLASALEGLDIRRCAERAAATGACCVEAYDSLSGLKPLQELDKLIASGWAQNT